MTDADARFDRTIERWFRDRLALDPEYATFLGMHDHDGELPSGVREQIEREVAPSARQRSTEMQPFDRDQLSAERALDRDLVIHQAQLGLYQLTELRPWARSHAARPSTSAAPSSRSSRATSRHSRSASKAWRAP